MVITQQFRTIPQRNGMLQPLAADGAGRAADASPARPAPPTGGPVSRRLRRLNRRVTIPYWMLAVTLTAMVAGSASAVRSFDAQPASAARAPIAQLAGVQPDEGLGAGLPAAANDSSDDTIDQLHEAIAAVTMNLERTERDNATLRDQQRQQSQDLSAAVNGAVFNEQQRAGEVQDVQTQGQQQTQQLQGEYNALMQGIAGQLSDLQQKAAAAAQLADKLKAALGV